MLTRYQIENIELANEYSKARKLIKLSSLEVDESILTVIKYSIFDGEYETDVMARAADDDREHWIRAIGKKAAADLLTLGKVQPETMLEMGNLPSEDFREAVKVATGTARQWNNDTVAAEQELNTDTVDDSLV